jgi:glycosyltransferase involved in cell wall biosynthesis
VSPPGTSDGPRLLVLSSLFPSDAQPAAGLFIRERMFRVGRHIPLVVVAPQPWFPLQRLIRAARPHFRPPAPTFERMLGFDVYRPRFLSFPGVLKRLDGVLMALSIARLVRRLVRAEDLNVLDVHFGYPDGAAGTLLGRWLRLPVLLTLRGKEERQARTGVAGALGRAIRRADQLVTVSTALRELAIRLGAAPERVHVIGNGVDLDKFQVVPRAAARAELGVPPDASVLVSVGTLVERKGVHRVIACLPGLLRRHPKLQYLVVGGAGPEGDFSAELRDLAVRLGVADRVHFLGVYAPERLKVPLSAADVFVLATRYEGWANVFLEAMACGLPVVTTRVGGNPEVVSAEHLGVLVPFGQPQALEAALDGALAKPWDRDAIIRHARDCTWERRIPSLVATIRTLHERHPRPGPAFTEVSRG